MIGDFRAMAASGKRDDDDKPAEPRKEYKKPVFTGKAKLKAEDKPVEEAQNSKQNYDFSGLKFSQSSNKRHDGEAREDRESRRRNNSGDSFEEDFQVVTEKKRRVDKPEPQFGGGMPSFHK